MPATRTVRIDLTGGALLPDGTIALATALRGVLIMDETGRVRQRIDRRVGLRDNHVLALLTDRQGGLWAGLQHGLSRIAVSPQFSVFDERSGLEREWREVIEYGGMLYARGDTGLYAASLSAPAARSAAPRRELRFEKIAAIGPPVRAFVVADGRLLVSAVDGIHEVQGTTARRVMHYSSTPVTLYRSRRDPARVYVGLEAGLASMRLERGSWQDEGRVEGIAETITSIGEGDDGDLWVVSHRQRVLRVSRDGALPPRAHAYPLGDAPLTGRIAIREVARRSVFLAEDGIYEFDTQANRFVPFASVEALAARIGARLPGSSTTRRAISGSRRASPSASISCAGNLTVATCSRILASSRRWRGRSIPSTDRAGVDLHARLSAAIRPRGAAASPVAFATQLRRVTTTASRSSTAARPSNGWSMPRLPYSQRSLQFEFRGAALRRHQAQRVSVVPRGLRESVVGMAIGVWAQVHEPAGTGTTLSRPRPRQPGTCRRAGLVRVHRAAAVVSDRLGLHRLHRAGVRRCSC